MRLVSTAGLLRYLGGDLDINARHRLQYHLKKIEKKYSIKLYHNPTGTRGGGYGYIDLDAFCEYVLELDPSNIPQHPLALSRLQSRYQNSTKKS